MNKPSYILKRHQDFLDKKINLEQVHKEYEQKISEIKDANCIITDCFDVNHPVNITDNPLSGSIYTLKDNVVTKGIRTTGASKFLDNFIPPYDATLYSLLKQSGAILTSKCNLDQFGMAGTGTYSDYGIVKNVHDQTRITGGSSSGSVNLVAAKAVDFAIGSDTGDSIRRPAAFAGVVGYKPTYGLISRYGVLPYSPSLDHLGIITNSVIDAALVADQICQFDPKDYTSQKLDHEFFKNLKIQKNLKIAVIKGIENDIQENERKIYLNTLDFIKNNGHAIIEKEANQDILDCLGVTYQIISNVEGLSCYSSFTGIPFGENLGGKDYKDILTKNRSAFINSQVKRRLIYGIYVSSSDNFDKIYIKAKKIRTLLINLANDLLDGVDCLLIPSSSCIAPKIDDALNNRCKSTHADDALDLANFAGLPSITIPAGKYNNMPYGININCKQFKDQDVLNIAYTIEDILGGNNE